MIPVVILLLASAFWISLRPKRSDKHPDTYSAASDADGLLSFDMLAIDTIDVVPFSEYHAIIAIGSYAQSISWIDGCNRESIRVLPLELPKHRSAQHLFALAHKILRVAKSVTIVSPRVHPIKPFVYDLLDRLDAFPTTDLLYAAFHEGVDATLISIRSNDRTRSALDPDSFPKEPLADISFFASHLKPKLLVKQLPVSTYSSQHGTTDESLVTIH